jgi:hypothetical protein
MAVTIENADLYINLNVIDIEDWDDTDANKKQRILNTGARVLSTAYPEYEIPDGAVYEYAAILATAFNDTNRLQMQGIEQISIADVGSFKFNRVIKDLAELIPQAALDLIGIENGTGSLNPLMKVTKWTVV